MFCLLLSYLSSCWRAAPVKMADATASSAKRYLACVRCFNLFHTAIAEVPNSLQVSLLPSEPPLPFDAYSKTNQLGPLASRFEKNTEVFQMLLLLSLHMWAQAGKKGTDHSKHVQSNCRESARAACCVSVSLAARANRCPKHTGFNVSFTEPA